MFFLLESSPHLGLKSSGRAKKKRKAPLSSFPQAPPSHVYNATAWGKTTRGWCATYLAGNAVGEQVARKCTRRGGILKTRRENIWLRRGIFMSLFQHLLCNRNRQTQWTICDDHAELNGIEHGCFGAALRMPVSSNTFYRLRQKLCFPSAKFVCLYYR